MVEIRTKVNEYIWNVDRLDLICVNLTIFQLPGPGKKESKEVIRRGGFMNQEKSGRFLHYIRSKIPCFFTSGFHCSSRFIVYFRFTLYAVLI